MGAPTRLKNGVNNLGANDALNMMGQLDPTTYHTFFDDFNTYVASGSYTVTGGGSCATTPVNGGALLVTNANTDEAIQQIQVTSASFLPVAGKKTFFKTRFKLSAVAQDCFVGLSVIDTTLIAASVIDTVDAIGFFKAATDTTWSFYTRLDATTGSTSATGIGAVSADTYLELAFYFDGVSKVYYAYNNTIAGSVSGSATYLPDAQLSPSFAIGQEGTGGAGTATVDYIFAAQER